MTPATETTSTKPTYGITYGLVSYGGDEVNSYSVWEHRDGYGYRPICPYQHYDDALAGIYHWRRALAINPQIRDDTRWIDQPHGKGQSVVLDYS